MATKLWAIGLILLCTLLTTTAQIFLKLGINNFPQLLLQLQTILGIILDWPLILGIFLYGIGAVLMIIAFKGGDVTVLYPIFASSYIWVSLLSAYFFADTLSLMKIAGVFIVILGISFIALGSKKHSAIEYVEAP